MATLACQYGDSVTRTVMLFECTGMAGRRTPGVACGAVTAAVVEWCAGVSRGLARSSSWVAAPRRMVCRSTSHCPVVTSFEPSRRFEKHSVRNGRHVARCVRGPARHAVGDGVRNSGYKQRSVEGTTPSTSRCALARTRLRRASIHFSIVFNYCLDFFSWCCVQLRCLPLGSSQCGWT